MQLNERTVLIVRRSDQRSAQERPNRSSRRILTINFIFSQRFAPILSSACHITS